MKITFALLFALLFTVACGEKKAEDNKAQNTEEKAENTTEENADDAGEPEGPGIDEAEYVKERVAEASKVYQKLRDLNCECYNKAEGDVDALNACMKKRGSEKILEELKGIEDNIGADTPELKAAYADIDSKGQDCSL